MEKKEIETTPTETKAIVAAIEFADVRGNKLLYLKIQGNGKEVLVNIGQKTFDSVRELCVPRETSTKIQVLPSTNMEQKPEDAIKGGYLTEKKIG